MSNVPYHIVIGLEVHVQLLTRTKLFCGCSTQFGLPPNSATCPICIGMPGVMPVMNRKAFELSLKAALALDCTIAPFTKWDRKNYYYPDLPKNYQISQYDLPFSHDGKLTIQTPAGPKVIRIIRVHLEEDAGKSIHDESGGGKESRVDLNRTGTPLLEIVSHPDMATPEEAKAYLEEIRPLLRDLEVSDCEMQEGSLRCDANINLHIPQPDGSFVATPIVEVKNLNSFRGVEHALKFEANRQFREYQDLVGSTWEVMKENGRQFEGRLTYPLGDRHHGELRELAKTTAGWDDVSGRTKVQRRKEEASDYRYFPEPDLVPVLVDAEWIERVRAGTNELPAAQHARLRQQYQLSEYDTEVITRQGRAFVGFFEMVAKQAGDANEAKNWMTNEVLQTLNERKINIGAFPIAASAIADLITELKKAGINKQAGRGVYAAMLADDVPAKQAIAKFGKPMADEGQLLEIIRKAIADNPKAVTDFKNGKVKAADAIKGAVMRQTKGMAKTDLVQQLLMQELQK